MTPAVQSVLDRLHERMERERDLERGMPGAQFEARIDEFMLAVGEDAGRLLNLLAKAVRIEGRPARTILEVGTSVGYSTLWLADAAREIGGRVITLDSVPAKHEQARAHLDKAGLLEHVTLITDDAVRAIAALPDTIDLVLLDCWKDAYIPCFEAFHPKLAPGALIAADNLIFPESPAAREYQAHVRSRADYESVLLPIGNGIELSRKAPDAAQAQPGAAVRAVLERLQARMREEDGLRATLSAEAFAARRPELMLAIGEDAGRWLRMLVRAGAARSVLEIGTSGGYSTLWLADGVSATGGHVTSVDASAAKHEQARANLSEAGLQDAVTLLTGFAPGVLATLPGPFDLVLIDCERHDYEACLEAVLPKLAPGALIAADNMMVPPSPHAPRYQARVRAVPGMDSVLVPIGNGIELSRTHS